MKLLRVTHEPLNQPVPLVGYDVFGEDRVLVEALRASDAAWSEEQLRALGLRAGSQEAIACGFEANRYPPRLLTHDGYGTRLDEVEYHPSYHGLMRVAVESGLHVSSWSEPRAGAHVARAAAFFVWSQVDAGHGCPISMTHAVVPVLRRYPVVFEEWKAAIFARTYEPRLLDRRSKTSALFGMALTEKQSGSDLRANTTRAVPVSDGAYELSGQKWFCSAPMSDAFLVLAQAPGGLSCFLMPRVSGDGSRNRFLIQRLKDKLGNRSNASAEVEFDRATATLLGEEGRGVQTIVEMVNFTRLDCALASAAGMRQAVAQAVHHAYGRSAFGSVLADQPLMRNVLADLALESEAATLLCLRLARACDRADEDPQEAAFKRIGTALAKYWVCRRAAPHAAEALEVLGGNGYVEESIMPRLFRESPLNSIWEGAGNVNALDVLRVLAKEPGALEAFLAECEPSAAAEPRLQLALDRLKRELLDKKENEARARRIVERLALALQAALVVRASPPFVADAFCASRLGGDWGRAFGTLPAGIDHARIVERARPIISAASN